MDDIVTSAPNEQEAKQITTSLINTLKKGQYDLRTWTCSEPHVTLPMPPEYRKTNENLKFLQDTHTIKSLRIMWNPKFHVFHFRVTHLNKTISPKIVTKRHVLGDIAKSFDSLGWLLSISINLKILMQRIWVAKLVG